jgi:hypothetical protein
MLAGMNLVIAWAGFLGAWLLMAGPLYQGALELLEEDIDREGIDASIARIPRPDPPSPWWWLVPPVMYLIRRHRGRAFRRAALAQLTRAQRDQAGSFINKAAGWFTVALGAALLAAAQTWQVINRLRWPAWLFWILIIVMLGVSVANTALRIRGRAAGSAVQPADEVSSTCAPRCTVLPRPAPRCRRAAADDCRPSVIPPVSGDWCRPNIRPPEPAS